MKDKPLSIKGLQKKKENNELVVGLSVYNYSIARLADESGCDWILVGDSVGMCEMGYKTTLPVTMEDMLVHCKGVVRGVKNALIIGDMPFLSFQTSPAEAVKNAGRFMQIGVSGVKVEGAKCIDNIVAIINAGIPVMGHLGLTPQSFYQLGGFKVIGREEKEWEGLIESARILEQKGVFAIILEAVVPELARKIHDSVSIPVYGIGAGDGVDGQILIINDILGLSFDIKPRFAKEYVNLKEIIGDAIQRYIKEVREGIYPDSEHSY